MANLPVPQQRSWNVGDVVTAAMLNQNVRDAVNFLLNPPAFLGIQSTLQSIPNGAWTGINIDTVQMDTYTGHNDAAHPSRYYAQVPGVYRVSGQADFVGNNTSFRSIKVQIDSGAYSYGKVQIQALAGYDTGLSTSVDVYLNINDYVEVAVYQFSGGALSLGNADGPPRVSVVWCHA
jgi:hypothetical protein